MNKGNYPKLKGLNIEPFKAIAAAAQGIGNSIPAGATVVEVVGVTTNADDFIVLPSLQQVENGHRILVLGNAASNFEVRTPASSAQEINSEDCDGTKEYLFTDTEVHEFIKINNTIGWVGIGKTALGADNTPVVPD